MNSTGPGHIIAPRTDGTLFPWGDNSYGQRNLPTPTTYHNIEAGDDFSIGLDPASAILTAGKGDTGQVPGKPAGTETGAALRQQREWF